MFFNLVQARYRSELQDRRVGDCQLPDQQDCLAQAGGAPEDKKNIPEVQLIGKSRKESLGLNFQIQGR